MITNTVQSILFLQFFVNNYLLGAKKNVPPASKLEVAQQAAKDAVNDLENYIKSEWQRQSQYDEFEIPPEIKAKFDAANSRLRSAKAKLDEATKEPKAKAGEAADTANEKLHEAQVQARHIASEAKDDLMQAINTIKEKAQNGMAKAQEKGTELKDETGNKLSGKFPMSVSVRRRPWKC